MGLSHIVVFLLFAALGGYLGRRVGRGWLLLVASVLAIYWLQPATAIRNLDFWAPTVSLGLVIVLWTLTRSPDAGWTRDDAYTVAACGGLVLTIGLLRYSGRHLTATRPPPLDQIGLALLVYGLGILALARLGGAKPGVVVAAAMLILGIFVVLKSEPLGIWASRQLRSLTGQPLALAESADLRWFGFSYIALRLLHALRDRASGRLPSVTLREFLTYAIFFPALSAGPIDRVERFTRELRQPLAFEPSNVVLGGRRIAVGVFKKFVLADSLGLIALNSTNAEQVRGGAWLWVLLYAYAFQLFLDFSGYTDVAIGVGQLAGIRLPENFDRPYLKANIAAFWNSWHITLAQWWRNYFFNPATRAMRAGRRGLPVWSIVLIGQVGTMVLIGLWHGLTWNFLIWGLWHGVGLFVHNRWLELQRIRPRWFPPPIRAGILARGASTLLTFHFVVIGWLWFALPDIGQSARLLVRMVGR